MCCCKWCQYYLESIYWHCFEKHFCFDMNIALYEDEDTVKSSDFMKEQMTETQIPSYEIKPRTANNNIYDNMAFYDNVAMIAKRSIFIIDPQDVKKPIVEDSTTTSEDSESLRGDKSFSQDDIRLTEPDIPQVITEQPKFKRISFNDIATTTKSEPNLTQSDAECDDRPPNDSEAFKSIPLIRTNTTSLSSLATISEENHDKNVAEPNPMLLSLPQPNGPVKLRKKSLHERRVSKSLTLDIDNKRQEVPIIRQSSFPKFYIDTPDVNQNTSTIGPNAIQALETPVVPNTFQFDLKTVVQLQNERRELAVQQQQQHQYQQHGLRRSVTSVNTTRIQQIRDKLKPSKLLRNASTQSLYSQSKD